MEWKKNKQIELKYRTTLKKINKKIMDAIKNTKTLEEINKALKKIHKSKSFQDLADLIAKRFVTNANIIDAKTWREAARVGSKGNEIYKALQKTLNTNIGKTVNKQIEENAKLIKTLPLDLSKEVTKFVSTKAYAGIRPSETAKILETKIYQYSGARANTIARTETSKCMSNLTEARAKDIGVNWYRWSTANDGNRVRESHRNMQGVLVRFDDPPSPETLVNEKDVGHYNAGCIYNCRCFPRAILSLDTVRWPCRVYYNGSIQSMTRQQFKKIM